MTNQKKYIEDALNFLQMTKKELAAKYGKTSRTIDYWIEGSVEIPLLIKQNIDLMIEVQVKEQNIQSLIKTLDKNNNKNVQLGEIQQSVADIITEGEIFECEKCGTELTIFDTECGECGKNTNFEIDHRFTLGQIGEIFELIVENKK